MLAALAQGGASGGDRAHGGGAAGRGAGAGSDAEQGLPALVRFEAERAREWFDRGIALTQLLDRRSAASVLAMAGIYRRLLERIAADPEGAVRRRVSLPAREKAWVAARGMIGGGA
jgi:phytoene synthase